MRTCDRVALDATIHSNNLLIQITSCSVRPPNSHPQTEDASPRRWRDARLHLEQHLVLKRRPGRRRARVALILQHRPVRHFQRALPPGPDLNAFISIARPQPQRDPILPLANGHHRAAHPRAALVHRLPQQGEGGVEPPLVPLALFGVGLGHGHHELSALDVGFVLPHGLDAGAEEVVVAVHGELGGGEDVVEGAPELFGRGEGRDVFQIFAPGRVRRSQTGIVVPERPGRVERYCRLLGLLRA
mmetsp:Transcript_8303/g.18111  ORF Transcript_8303/g.18111 Transcript_8303/m.18111 type:complete len:244 (+) Transcript_8303:442-1173(+)